MDFKRMIRNTHKWDAQDTCIHCGGFRFEVKQEGKQWNWIQYVDTETGEITRKLTCKTKQLELDFN